MDSTNSNPAGQEAPKLAFPPPKDMPTECYQRVKDSARPRFFVNHPARIFHLKPQFGSRMPGSDWEKTFLFQKVSVPHMKAEYLDPVPFPGLDLPPNAFPREFFVSINAIRSEYYPDPEKLIPWAKSVLNYVEPEAQTRARTAIQYARPAGYPVDDLRAFAVQTIENLAADGYPEATWIIDQIRNRKHLLGDLQWFMRFRDHNGVPNGLGFRPTTDTLFLDSGFLDDFLEHTGQNPSSRLETPLIPFLNGEDRANIAIVAVSVDYFHSREVRALLCHALVRSFPNIQHVKLVTVGVAGRKPQQVWDSDTKFGQVQGFTQVVRQEVLRNGGSSFMGPDSQDSNGASSGDVPPPGRTPVVAYGLAKGLIVDPEEDLDGDTQSELVAGIERQIRGMRNMYFASREVEHSVAVRDVARKRDGSPTMLPRPATQDDESMLGASPRIHTNKEAPRLTRAEFERQRNEKLGSHRSMAPKEDSESTVPRTKLIAQQHYKLVVEPVILTYYRDAFDRAVANGWRMVGSTIDLSHLGMQQPAWH
ncbi:hypothetical protein VM1G_05253 [Cytospora mali]|uniref:Uncharacterized protein n=1 Tax=Cytospora mali TaxID=578113 RepID=A0A194W1J3_CYTMA|nr:hypothetical protein VM1G_05253 [Valsa mali]